MSITENDISALLARVECYESCIDQLKKELPKYFQKHSQASKEAATFSKTLRNVASLESNPTAQSAIFLYAQKTENIETERKVYEKCHTATVALLDVAKLKMIAPAKEIVFDMRAQRKKKEKLLLQQQSKLLGIADLESLQLLRAQESHYSQVFPIHSEVFEEHRVKSLKKLLSMVLYTELRYHCRVIEELTEVLDKVQAISIS